MKKLLAVVSLLSALAYAGNLVDQGAPGTFGPWKVTGMMVATGPDGGAVQVNLVQSIPVQVFMDGGQHVIADQGAPAASPWACYVAMDGGQKLADNQSVNVNQWGGTNTTLGQKTMAASVPVVLPSDQPISVTLVFDGGQTISTFQRLCTASSVHTNTSVGGASTVVPAAALAGRIYITVCNTDQNIGNRTIKCRADGVAPVFAAGNAGDFMEQGDCVLYAAASANTIRCIASAAATNVLSFECLP